MLDAFCAQAPVFQLAAEAGGDLVVNLKRNDREQDRSAASLFARRAADCRLTERRAGRSYQIRIRDTGGMPFSVDHP